MEQTRNKSIYGWMRSPHRDIGFFAVGLTLIYGISGLILTYRNTDFLKSETQVGKTIAPNLKANQLSRALHQEVKVANESEKEIIFTKGTYNKETGVVSCLSLELPWILRQFNGLHFVSGTDARHWFTSLSWPCLVLDVQAGQQVFQAEGLYRRIRLCGRDDPDFGVTRGMAG